MGKREVLTIEGLIPFEDMEVVDIIKDTDNSRDIATEYWLAGKLVRRDVCVSVLRPLEFNSKEGAVGG